MSGSLLQSWDYFVLDLWQELAEYTNDDDVAPSSLFSDLFVTADEFLSPRPTLAEIEEARNDSDKARRRFLTLRGSDFTSEFSIVSFLEEVRNVVTGYEIPGFEDHYVWLLREVLRKFNLRYRLDDPFSLRFLLPGSFANLYSELQRANMAGAHLPGLLIDFEKTFDRYARTLDSTDLRQCIHSASNYVEGLASVAAGIPPKGNTLSPLVNKLTDWPHAKVREALVDLYHFCSDYPGIRHPGTPANALRTLEIRDATLATLLLLSFSGYLSSSINERAVLGI